MTKVFTNVAAYSSINMHTTCVMNKRSPGREREALPTAIKLHDVPSLLLSTDAPPLPQSVV
eukprot:scaffold2532_cov79-Skeletonema_menzelii.AAC.33